MTESQIKALTGSAPTIMLDKPYPVHMTFNSLAEIEARTGRSFLHGAQSWANMSMKEVKVIIWAALVALTPTMTTEFIGKHLDMANIEEVTKTCISAVKPAKGSAKVVPLEVPAAIALRSPLLKKIAA